MKSCSLFFSFNHLFLWLTLGPGGPGSPLTPNSYGMQKPCKPNQVFSFQLSVGVNVITDNISKRDYYFVSFIPWKSFLALQEETHENVQNCPHHRSGMCDSTCSSCRAVRTLPEVLEDAPSSVLLLPVLEAQEDQVGHGSLCHPAGRGNLYAANIWNCTSVP